MGQHILANDVARAGGHVANTLSLPLVRRQSWSRQYAKRLAATDAIAVIIAVAVAYLVRFNVSGLAFVAHDFSPRYLSLSIVLAATWFAALSIAHSRDRRVVGTGPGEYSRVFGATWRLFAVLAIFSYVFRFDIGRGFVGFAAPLGVILLFAGRLGWRRWLRKRRLGGEYQSGIVVIGHRDTAVRLIDELHRSPSTGYEVVGVCIPAGEIASSERLKGVPILGSMEEAARVAVDVGASAVAVTGADALTSDAVRRLGWDLEGKGIDLVLTLALVDIAGPRVIMQPVSELPLMYVDEPQFKGGKYVLKSAFDWTAAAVITLLISPVLVGIAIVIKATSPGPILFSQERVGRDGRHFKMLKFRSMVEGAHDQLGEVLALEGMSSIVPFYKPRKDPRVTTVGRFLRKYSLDELPQLLNVLRGEMSLVGPRPQIDVEVAQYDRAASRRLLVKPGLTGRWQVSGRNEIAPEDGIRMDISYVENWTLLGDVLILLRTFGVMVSGKGAY